MFWPHLNRPVYSSLSTELLFFAFFRFKIEIFLPNAKVSPKLDVALSRIFYFLCFSDSEFGSAWYGTARHGTALHGTARHGTARHGTARHGKAWCRQHALQRASASGRFFRPADYPAARTGAPKSLQPARQNRFIQCERRPLQWTARRVCLAGWP